MRFFDDCLLIFQLHHWSLIQLLNMANKIEKSTNICVFYKSRFINLHGENFMAIFTTLSVVIWVSTGTLGIFSTLVYIFTIRLVIYDILSMVIIPTLSISILFCNLSYILLWISPRSVVPYGYSKFCNVDTHKKIKPLCGDFYHTVWQLLPSTRGV